MKYVIDILKAIFSIAVFVAAASIASSEFQNIVIAGLGLIYVTADLGIASLSQKQGESMLSNLRFFMLVLKTTAKEDVDSPHLERKIETAEKRLDQNKVALSIHAIAGTFILLGCIYLILGSVFV